MANQKKYYRIDRAERISIERGLNNKESARSIARNLFRSQSSITDKVKRNRVVTKGPEKGEKLSALPEDVCSRLLSWPYVCNGCRYRRYHCSFKFRCEYRAFRAQAFSEYELHHSRRGINKTEQDFSLIISLIRNDLARGLSPEQICMMRSSEIKVSSSTIRRWISLGYAGMSNLDLRRQVGYKPRKTHTELIASKHGYEHSYQAFLELSEEDRFGCCEMDTVLGSKGDSQCILTLYCRPLKLQVCLLLADKSQTSVIRVVDMLEECIGKELFIRLFGTILTDNGREFANHKLIERSVFGGKPRCRVYYCDVRQSQQKAGCERNHVELRKILPKGYGIRFDSLDCHDMAVLMSHLNSEPRASLLGANPLSVLKAMLGEKAETLMEALGIEEIPYKSLDMTYNVVNKERASRGLDPIL